MSGRFNVCQFFPDGSYEYVRRDVVAAEAVSAAIHYASSVGARLGTTVRVIVTDADDCVNWEWTHEEGVIFGMSEEAKGWLKGGIVT